MKGNHDLKRMYLVVSLAIIFTAYIIFGLNNSYGDLVGEASKSLICTDSDGGQNIFVRGTTKGPDWNSNKKVTKKDNCVNRGEKAGRLDEFYCLEGKVADATFGPEEGCSICKNGACVSISSIQVISPNGGEIWQTGSVQEIQWSSIKINPNQQLSIFAVSQAVPQVHHYIVNSINDGYEKIKVSIPAGQYKLQIATTLSSGGVVEVVVDDSDNPFSIVAANCTDSDGGVNYNTQGTTCVGNDCKIDICLDGYFNGDNLAEYYCESLTNKQPPTDRFSVTYFCPNGCQDGACVQEEPSLQVLSPNGGEVWEQNPAKGQFVKWSGATERKPSDFKVALTDPRGNFVGWIMHNSPQKDPAGGFQLIWDVISACKTEFVGGFTDCFKVSPEFYKVEVVDMITKKTDASDAPFSIVPLCYDSDGGINYYIKGYVSTNYNGQDINNKVFDSCISPDPNYPNQSIGVDSCSGQNCQVEDFYCDGYKGPYGSFYNCPYGCKDGACINQTAVCGNGILDPGETCDGANFGGIKSCTEYSQSFSGGTLKCAPSCQIDTSACILSSGGNQTNST